MLSEFKKKHCALGCINKAGSLRKDTNTQTDRGDYNNKPTHSPPIN